MTLGCCLGIPSRDEEMTNKNSLFCFGFSKVVGEGKFYFRQDVHDMHHLFVSINMPFKGILYDFCSFFPSLPKSSSHTLSEGF